MEIFGFSSKSSENMIFWNFKSYSCTCIYLKGIHFQKCGCRGIRQNWFSISVQSHMKIVCFFWNVKSYSCIYLIWIHSKNMAREALDRNSWILHADNLFNSKSREYRIFWNVKRYSCMYCRVKFTSKMWLHNH